MSVLRRQHTNLAIPTNSAPLLVLGVAEQPWMADALCSQVDTDMFYPDKGGSVREPKAICARCPVAAACLDYALDNETDGYRYGVWGGTSPKERRTIARRRSIS